MLDVVELSGTTLTTTTIRWSFRRHGSPDYVEATVAEQVDIPGRWRQLFHPVSLTSDDDDDDGISLLTL